MGVCSTARISRGRSFVEAGRFLSKQGVSTTINHSPSCYNTVHFPTANYWWINNEVVGDLRRHHAHASSLWWMDSIFVNGEIVWCLVIRMSHLQYQICKNVLKKNLTSLIVTLNLMILAHQWSQSSLVLVTTQIIQKIKTTLFICR